MLEVSVKVQLKSITVTSVTCLRTVCTCCMSVPTSSLYTFVCGVPGVRFAPGIVIFAIFVEDKEPVHVEHGARKPLGSSLLALPLASPELVHTAEILCVLVPIPRSR